MMFCSKRPTDLAIAFVAAMAAHDTLPGHAHTSEKAMVHIRYAVQFCWTAHKKLLLTLCYTLKSHDARIRAWAAALHAAHIMHVKMNMQTGMGPSDETMQGMTSSVATLSETMTTSYLLAVGRDEKKSDGFKKMGSHHWRMILNASTVNMNLPGTAPIPSLTAFLDLKTSGQARSHLKYELQNRFGLNFEPSQAFATALHAGHLLWDRMDCPSNFSVFFCGRSLTFAATSRESRMLHMASTEGGGFLEAQIIKALKQPRSLPVDAMQAVEKIQSFHGAI
jgi:hypothetical protein